MGWNDRLPEDPFIPYESEKDRDDYEAWHMYLAMRAEEMLAEENAGLTSQNIAPIPLGGHVQEQPNTGRQRTDDDAERADEQKEKPAVEHSNGA